MHGGGGRAWRALASQRWPWPALQQTALTDSNHFVRPTCQVWEIAA